MRKNPRLLQFYKLYKPLILATFFATGVLMYRLFHTQSMVFTFLSWNLFLAALPFVFSFRLKAHRPAVLNGAKLALCLLFLPNAPYIVTDLFHLKAGFTNLLWLDTLLIGSFAWTGLLFYFYSLQNIERFLKLYLKPFGVRLFSLGICFLSGFGIYLGRYLRFNSWDILSSPLSLFYEMAQIVLNPSQHKLAWAVTFFYGLFLLIIYSGFKPQGKRQFAVSNVEA